VRVNDLTPPTVTGPRPGTDMPMGRWPAQLYIALERLAAAAVTWDDPQTGAWDDPAYTWDMTGTPYSAWTDATCSMEGLEVETGADDPDGRFESARAAFTLDNRNGAWSSRDVQGRLVDYGPGTQVAIWATLNTAQWWLFAGRVTSWREHGEQVDVEAFDAFTALNQTIPEWNPGTYGQRPGPRITSILSLVGYTGATRLATGDVTLHSYLTTASPLEELQNVAASDGGLVGVDADGTVLYVDRSWPAGRSDQTTVPTVSDNVCTVPAVVWDLDVVVDDDVTANQVTLTNVAGVTVTAQDNDSISLMGGPRTLTRTGDQWIDQVAGQTLARYMVARRAPLWPRVEPFRLYLHDPNQPQLWPVGIDLRVGDRMTLVRDQPAQGGDSRLSLTVIAARIVHTVNPAEWVVEIDSSRSVGATGGGAYWDRTGTWDDGISRWGY